MKKRQQMTNSIKAKNNDRYPSFDNIQELYKTRCNFTQDLKSLQNLLSINFKPNKLNQKKQFLIVQLLKKHSFIMNLAFNFEEFNFSSLISFINENRIDYSLLNLLEDILLPICRKIPHKVLSIFIKNKKIRQTFIKYIYIKHVYKILYTLVFCCQKDYLQQFQQILSEIMNCMINSIFQFISYPNSYTKTLKLLDFGQITQNFKVFLFDLCNNLVSVEFSLIQKFVSMLIKQGFLEKSFEFFQKYKVNQQFEDYCEGIIQIHIHMVKLQETIILSSNQNFNSEQKKFKKQIQNLLSDYTHKLENKLQYLIDTCVIKKTERLNFSSGQKLEIVGMIRYRILELIQKLLNLTQLTNLKINYEKLNFVQFFECFLQKFKWNNLVQILIFKIFQTIITQDQNHFILKHLIQIQSSSYNFFGNLIVNFINNDFLFLHSLRNTYQGNRSILFLICKYMIHQIQQKSDISILFKKIPFWKEFILKDMKKYQETHYQISKLFNQSFETNSSEKRIQRRQSIVVERHSKSLQTIEQILQNLKQADKWSPVQQKNANFKKNQILQDEVFRQMDSLVQHQYRK